MHLIPARPGIADPVAGGEGIDHIAFLRDDHEAFRERLDAQRVPYSRMELPEIGEHRLFLHTPGGALIEVAFQDRKPAHAPTEITLLRQLGAVKGREATPQEIRPWF